MGMVKNGAARWENTIQCDYFADKFKNVAQEQFFEDTFHSWNPGESPAIGVIWYYKNGSGATKHAIIAVLLEDNTLIFVEPQFITPQEIKLTELERQSVYFRRF